VNELAHASSGAREGGAAPGDRPPDAPGAVVVGVANNNVTVFIIMLGGNHWPRYFMGSRRLATRNLLDGMVEMVEVPDMTYMILTAEARASSADPAPTVRGGRTDAGAG
jgi:hypothetical protein